MKKFLILIGVLITVGISFLVYVRITTRAVIHSGLSDRAKDYLKVKRNENDREWQSTDLEKPSNPGSEAAIKPISDPECFSVTIPIPASEIRSETGCQYHVFLADPVGEAVVFRRTVSVSNIDEVADVTMRRLYKDQYSEKQIQINGRTFLVFKKLSDRYERSAFVMINTNLYVFSIVVQTNENLDRQFDEMLRSAAFYNE